MTYANKAIFTKIDIQTIQTKVLQASISNIPNLKELALYGLYMRIWGNRLSDKAVMASLAVIKKLTAEAYSPVEILGPCWGYCLHGSQALDFASASLREKVHGARCRVFKSW